MANLRAVLELGTSKIICMIDTSGIKEMDIPAASCIRYEGIRNGYWANSNALPVAVEDAITTAEHKCSRQIRNLNVGVPAEFSCSVLKETKAEVSAGVVTHEFLKNMAEAAKPKNLVDYTLIEVRPIYFLDSSGVLYVDLPTGIHTKSLTAMFSYFFAKKSFITDITAILNGMHIHVNGFANELCHQAIKYIPENERFSTAILLDVGYTVTTVSAVYNDAVMATDIINMGGESFVQDLRKSLDITTQIAESLKRGHVFGLSISRGSPVYGRDEDGRMISFSQTFVRDIIEDRMYELCNAVSASINGFIRKKIISRNAGVFLSGAGIVMKGADTFVQNILGKNVFPVRNTKFPIFTSVYNTAFSLLDNEIDRAYDLCGGVYQSQLSSRLGKLFK